MTLTLEQAVAFIITLLTIVGGAWVDMRVKVARTETRQDDFDARIKETRNTEDDHYKELKASIQTVYDKLVEIQVELQNKENRK